MPSEKIYYGVLIFLCIASMLLSPFFYAGALKPKKAALRKDGQWKLILIVQYRGGGGFGLGVVEMVLTDIAQNRANGIRTNKEFCKKFVKSTN